MRLSAAGGAWRSIPERRRLAANGAVRRRDQPRAEAPVTRAYTPQNVLAPLYRVPGLNPATMIPDHAGRPVYLLDERDPIAELV